MATKTLPILPGVVLAYDDLRRVLRAMRTLMIYALLIILALKVLEEIVPARTMSGALSGNVISFAIGAAQSFCLTPIIIAVHRFIILDEVTTSYAVDPSQPRFIALFSWLVALSILSMLVFGLQEFLTALGVSTGAAIGPGLMVAIIVTIVSLRLTILFPAIAVGARGATAGNALEDSKGHVISIFLIFLLALLRMAALAIGVTLLLGRGEMVHGSTLSVIGLVAGGFIQTASITLCVAIASRIFQRIGSRLRVAG
jgi:hypothetical protein